MLFQCQGYSRDRSKFQNLHGEAPSYPLGKVPSVPHSRCYTCGRIFIQWCTQLLIDVSINSRGFTPSNSGFITYVSRTTTEITIVKILTSCQPSSLRGLQMCNREFGNRQRHYIFVCEPKHILLKLYLHLN